MEEEKKSSNKLTWLIILLLIIIIIILLFLWRVGKVEEKYLIPTGNVDVFNIDTVCKCKKCSDTKGDQTEIPDLPSYNEKTDKEVLGELFVDDKNGNFIFQQNLRIFDNAAYEYENKIAPGVSNTYYFVVHNNSNVKVKYNILMYEESEYKINLKYRLKRNNKYIIGDDDTWVTFEDLKTAYTNLDISSSDSYSLDWKWFDDDENDNIAGKNMTSEYKLNIRISYEEI